MLGSTVERRRDAATAESFLRKLLRDQPVVPEAIVTDGLGSYKTALDRLGLSDRHRPGRLRDAASAQRFLTVHAAVHNTSYTQRHLVGRGTLRLIRAKAHAPWIAAVAS